MKKTLIWTAEGFVFYFNASEARASEYLLEAASRNIRPIARTLPLSRSILLRSVIDANVQSRSMARDLYTTSTLPDSLNENLDVFRTNCSTGAAEIHEPLGKAVYRYHDNAKEIALQIERQKSPSELFNSTLMHKLLSDAAYIAGITERFIKSREYLSKENKLISIYRQAYTIAREIEKALHHSDALLSTNFSNAEFLKFEKEVEIR